MKFNYKNRGFVVLSLSLMLIAVGVVNYQLSKDSTLSVSDEFKAYEQAQIDKNSPDDTTLVDSIDGKVTTDDKDKSTETSNSKDNTKDTAKENSDVENLAKETSKEIEDTLNSKENIDSDTYIVDMKMTREKQRNSLTQDLNEMINNPSTSEEARKEASSMKIQLVKDQEAELKIENILSMCKEHIEKHGILDRLNCDVNPTVNIYDKFLKQKLSLVKELNNIIRNIKKNKD